jgi:ribonuclease P protein component
LRSRGQFERVFKTGERFDGEGFLLIAARNDVGRGRLGLAVSRRIGNAVARNRVRRLLREAFRQQPERGTAVDLVIVAKPGLVGRGLAEVESEFRRRLERLGKRQARRGRTKPSVAD